MCKYTTSVDIPGVELGNCVNASTDLSLSLEDDHSATFIPRGQQVPCLVKLHRRDDISWGYDRKM